MVYGSNFSNLEKSRCKILLHFSLNWKAKYATLGAETFAGRNFRDFGIICHFLRKSLQRDNVNSRFTIGFAREIIGVPRLAKVFSVQFKFLRCCSLIAPIVSLSGCCKLSP